MRRPILAILVGISGGILIEYYVSIDRAMIVLCLLGSLLGSYYFHRKKEITGGRHPAALAAVWYPAVLFGVSFLAGALLFSFSASRETILTTWEGERIAVVGRVVSVQMKDEEYNRAEIKIQGVSGESGKSGKSGTFQKADETILANIAGQLSEPTNLIGRTILLKGTAEAASGVRNPRTFDYALYLKTQGINVILKAKSKDITIAEGEINLFFHFLAKVKYSFVERLNCAISPERAGILIGMLFGDKSYMDEDIYAAFQKNGIAHILSVSGIHVAIVYACMVKIMGKRRDVWFGVTAALLLFLYAALAEFSPSVVRAVTMILVHIGGQLAFQRYDLTCCTAACAIGMLIYNPYSLFNVGFQLSFLAVLTLAVALPWTARRIDFLRETRLPVPLINVLVYLSPLVVIQIGMAPYTAYCFNYFSLGAFLLNIPIIFLSGLVIPIGVLSMGISAIWDLTALLSGAFIWGQELLALPIQYIFEFTCFTQGLIIGGMEKINELFYKEGVSFFTVISPPVWSLILYYGLMFFMLSEAFRVLYQRKKRVEICRGIAVVLVASILMPVMLLPDYSHAKLVFVDVGQGDCLHIKTPEGKNILIDGGGSLQYDVGEKTLLPYLLKNGVAEIDLAVVSHLHDDHYLGLTQLSQSMKIKKLAVYEINRYREEQLMEETGVKKENILYVSKGQTLEVEKGVSIEILFPEKRTEAEYLKILEDEEDENKSSLIAKVSYEGLSLMMTGDMGFDGEAELIKLYPQSQAGEKPLTQGAGKVGALRSDILKVGHHGSKYSTSDKFVEVVSPNTAVFQVGNNNFGHPNQGVIEKFLNSGIMVFRNDRQGAIMLSKPWNLWDRLTNKDELWHIETMIRENMPLSK